VRRERLPLDDFFSCLRLGVRCGSLTPCSVRRAFARPSGFSHWISAVNVCVMRAHKHVCGHLRLKVLMCSHVCACVFTFVCVRVPKRVFAHCVILQCRIEKLFLCKPLAYIAGCV
jgi:hypothetical protein